MAREFHTDIDLKGALLLAGSAGTSGYVLKSQGSGQAPVWAAESGGGSVTAGDKGDISVDASGNWTIDTGVVTYAKIQNVSATDKVLGRSSAGAGQVQEITCTAAGRSLIGGADAAAQRQTLGTTAITIALS